MRSTECVQRGQSTDRRPPTMKRNSESASIENDETITVRRPWKIRSIPWLEDARTLGPILILSVLVILVGLHFVSPAPPRMLTIAGGPKGSTFAVNAAQYQKIMARSGIKLKIVDSEGS